MPDISMCDCIECKRAEHCYRFRAYPSEFRQSYMIIDPEEAEKCEMFWPLGPKNEFAKIRPLDECISSCENSRKARAEYEKQKQLRREARAKRDLTAGGLRRFRC